MSLKFEIIFNSQSEGRGSSLASVENSQVEKST